MTSSLNYIPCEAKDEHCLVYVTKRDPAHQLMQAAFGQSCYRHASLICGWDAGEYNGRALKALEGPARQCRKMYIITDLSWRGLLSASRAMKLCRPDRAEYIGINDDWLALASQFEHPDSYLIRAHKEDLRVHLTAAQRANITRRLGVGPLCKEILASGKELHLEAFCHEPSAKGLRRLLRSKL